MLDGEEALVDLAEGDVASWLEPEIDTLALASPDPGRGET